MSRKGRLVVVCVALTLASAGASYTYLSLKAGQNLERTRTRLQEGAGREEGGSPLSRERMGAGVGGSAAPVRISSSTEIVYKAIYECGHEETNKMTAPPEMVGLSREDLAREVDKWTVMEFSESRVTMQQRRIGMSPACEASMHIGEKDGWVAVFHGDPEHRCKLKSNTRLRVSDLPPSEREAVRKGIPVSDEEELLRILESLASWRDG